MLVLGDIKYVQFKIGLSFDYQQPFALSSPEKNELQLIRIILFLLLVKFKMKIFIHQVFDFLTEICGKNSSFEFNKKNKLSTLIIHIKDF